MKQFLTSYLNCQGMLFSRVGMDNFHDCCCEMLKLFHALLLVTPPRLSSTHLLQIVALNMFAIENTQLRGKFILDLMHEFVFKLIVMW